MELWKNKKDISGHSSLLLMETEGPGNTWGGSVLCGVCDTPGCPSWVWNLHGPFSSFSHSFSKRRG